MPRSGYQIITAFSADNLERFVSFELERGWVPLGAPFCIEQHNLHEEKRKRSVLRKGDTRTALAQAMVKNISQPG
jgi:hypothetical protein